MSMYSHGTVYDATDDAVIEVGNAKEAMAADPKRYFASKQAFDAQKARADADAHSAEAAANKDQN